MASLGSFIFISMEFLNNPFYEFGVLLIVASILGALGRLFKQPLIVTFIAVGILVGSAGLNIIDSEEEIQLLAEIGIALLLFVVGLKLDLNLMRSTGPVASITGLVQVIFTSIFWLSYWLAPRIFQCSCYLYSRGTYFFQYNHHCKNAYR